MKLRSTTISYIYYEPHIIAIKKTDIVETTLIRKVIDKEYILNIHYEK